MKRKLQEQVKTAPNCPFCGKEVDTIMIGFADGQKRLVWRCECSTVKQLERWELAAESENRQIFSQTWTWENPK